MISFLSFPLGIKILIFEIVAIDNFDLQNVSEALTPCYKNEIEKIMFAKVHYTSFMAAQLRSRGIYKYYPWHYRQQFEEHDFFATDLQRMEKLKSNAAMKYLKIDKVWKLPIFLERTGFSTDQLETLEILESRHGRHGRNKLSYEKLQNVTKIISHLSRGEEIAFEEFKNLKELVILRAETIFHIHFATPEVNAKANVKIGKLSNLKRLEMTGASVKDIDWIKGLKKLIELKFDHCDFESMQLCQFLKKLRVLKLSNNDIRKIEGLTNCLNLIELDLSGNKILKLEGLDNLKKLEKLELQNNSITTIENLDSLTSLKYLDLSTCSITHLQNLSGLTRLEFLNLLGNPITKIEHHEDLKFKKADIIIGKTGVDKKINTLNFLENIDHLSISSYPSFDVEHFERFPNLKSLDFKWDKLPFLLESLVLSSDTSTLNDKSLLPANKSLKYLDCGNYQLKSLDELLIFTGLRTLKINYGYDIKDWTPLSQLSKLTRLKISNSRIEDLKFLQQLSSIEYLDLSDNRITCLEDLQYCQSLRYLNLRSNHIHDIGKLSLLKSLQVLNVEGNPILDYSPLKELGSLELLCMGGKSPFLFNRDVLVIDTFKPLDDILKFFVAMSRDAIQINEHYGVNWLNLLRDYQRPDMIASFDKIASTLERLTAALTDCYDGVRMYTLSSFKHV